MEGREVKLVDFEVDAQGCFVCTSHTRDAYGYPVLNRYGKVERLSRYIYRECFGEIGKGMFICHHCDNPACINPEHLFQATPKENTQDMLKKGRDCHGAQHPFSKLKAEDVFQILKDNVHTQQFLADSYGVNQTTIHKIKRGESWRYLR